MNTNHKAAIFPGTFDPFTNGHIDIVERALRVFDTVQVAVLDNLAKAPLFTTDERKDLIREIFADSGPELEIGSFNGLLVEYVKETGCQVIIRGLRAISDYDYEAQMALMNRQLDHNIETLFMMTREENSYISSTMVKQIAPYGGDVSKLVHPVVEQALKRKFT